MQTVTLKFKILRWIKKFSLTLQFTYNSFVGFKRKDISESGGYTYNQWDRN